MGTDKNVLTGVVTPNLSISCDAGFSGVGVKDLPSLSLGTENNLGICIFLLILKFLFYFNIFII